MLMDVAMGEGIHLSQDQAEKLEQKLEVEPDDMESRAKLLGYYWGKRSDEERARRFHHTLWIIANRPDVDILTTSGCFISRTTAREDYEKARELWLKHLKDRPDNLAVLYNAANFFSQYEGEFAVQLFERGRGIEPDNPDWASSIGYQYQRASRHASPEDRKANAANALQEFERAYSLEGSSDYGRFLLLDNLATSAFDAAVVEKSRFYAEKLLQEADSYRGDPHYGTTVHNAYQVLGRVALLDGEVDKAKEHLISAATLSPHALRGLSFPSMSLALELLKLGEKEAVLEYLRLCGKFWNQKRLQEWESQIQEDHIPDFGVFLNWA
jgi:tetratricopeptide (TPR) repeat protein